MMILALEFSSRHRSVALVDRSRPDQQIKVLGQLSDGGAKSAQPLAQIHALLGQNECPPKAIDAVVVGLGPGSYTGVRSALALAQGWHLAQGVQVRGVSTMECLAFQAQARGWFGRVTIALDAQRGEFYLATYEIGPHQRALLQPLRLATADDLRLETAKPETVLIGPDLTKWSDDSREILPEAQALAHLVDWDSSQLPGTDLEPIYLRPTAFVKAPAPRIFPLPSAGGGPR